MTSCYMHEERDCSNPATTTGLVVGGPGWRGWRTVPLCAACAEHLDGYYEAQDQQNVAALLREGVR